jgi:hypothetical protein
MTSSPDVRKKGMIERFYNDPFIVEPETLDRGSKKVFRVISFLGGLGWSGFVLLVWIVDNPFRRHPEEGVFFFSLGIVGSWVGYRILRFIVWLFKGNSVDHSPINEISDYCKNLIPILIVLMLVPIVLHLWIQMTEKIFDWGYYWDIISISNDVPY